VPTLSADEVVHRLIAEDLEVRAALEEQFGTTDRTRIAEVVFTDPDQLALCQGDVLGGLAFAAPGTELVVLAVV